MQVDAEARAYIAVSQHPRAADLAAIARSVMTGAVQLRKVEHRPERVARLAAEMKLGRDEVDTPFGNALDVLEGGPKAEEGRTLARALAAHAVAAYPPKSPDEEERLAGDLLWLGAHTHFDATGLLDLALGGAAAGVWTAIANRVRKIDEGSLLESGRGEALVGAAALASSNSEAAVRLVPMVASATRDQGLARVLDSQLTNGEPIAPIFGEIAPAPRGSVATALLAMTGLLFLTQSARLFGRVALAYKKPAQLELLDRGADGVRVRWRVELLGRTLRDRQLVVPRAALVRATREVSYPGIAVYAGLLSLAAGSWVGVSTFVDGVRSASPSLIGWGLAIVALGVALDLGLSSVWPSARGRCRIIFVPRDGERICIGDVDTHHADALLARLAQ